MRTRETLFSILYIGSPVIFFCKSNDALTADAVIFLSGKRTAVFIKGGILRTRVFHLQQESQLQGFLELALTYYDHNFTTTTLRTFGDMIRWDTKSPKVLDTLALHASQA